MIRLLPFILFTGLLLPLQGSAFKPSNIGVNQDQSGVSTEDKSFLKPEDVSPYFIEWYLDLHDDVDLRQIWQSLGLKNADGRLYRCGDDCLTDTFDIELEGEARGNTVALEISIAGDKFYQYLIFKKKDADPAGGARWEFIGNVDSAGQKDRPPVYRIERGDGRTWFVIREQWASGTEMKAFGEVWYEIKRREVSRVLSYPIEGQYQLCGRQTGRTYKSIVSRHGLVNGDYTIPVQFLVSYNLPDCESRNLAPSLFAKGQKAYFVWNDERGRFVLDASQSEVTEVELNRVYSIESLSNGELLEYNFQELLEIANAGDAHKKGWLKRVLADLPESEIKASLQQALH